MKASSVGIRSRQWLRISLAVVVLMLGMAPVGLPILSDANWRSSAGLGAEARSGDAAAFRYQWGVEPGGETRVERSDDGGETWHRVAALPAAVRELEAVGGQESTVFARSDDALWVSEDGGETWARSNALTSRLTAMAVSHRNPGLIYAGTESSGLLRSNDSGATWQPVGGSDLLLGGSGAMSVGDVALNPDDEQIVYAATGVWLGTSSVRLAPLGVFMSVDGGREWFVMERASLGAEMVLGLEPVAGSPALVRVHDASGERVTSLVLAGGLRNALEADSPVRRAAAARAIALVGDRSALTALVARLDDPDPIAGERIVEAIAALGGREHLPALREALRSDDEAVRARAAHGIGLMGDADSVDELSEVLHSHAPMAARQAAEALGAIGSPEALDTLVGALGDGDSEATRHVALIGLTKAGQTATAPLEVALSSDDTTLRTNAAQALGWLKSAAAMDALIAALDDPDARVRSEAAWALGELGTDKARIALARATESETDADARRAAEAALARAELTAGKITESIRPDLIILRLLSQTTPTRWTAFALGVILALALLFAPPAPLRHHRA